MSFLLKYTVKDLFRSNSAFDSLIFINEKTTVEETLHLLVSKNILSVPIYDDTRKAFIGIIDMYQIMTFMAFAAYNPDATMTLNDVLAKVNLKQPASHLLGATGLLESDEINSLWVLPSTAQLKDPLEYLGKGIYRILVTTGEDVKSAKVITQTDLIRWIHTHWDDFGDYKNVILKDHQSLNVTFLKHVHTVQITDSAIQSFQLMRLKQVNALAVVNSTGSMVATLSDADLRGLTHEKLNDLFLTIEQYLTKIHGGHIRKPITCKATDSFKTVVDLLVNEKVHRVWVVDDTGKPHGVVSMTDVALFFYSNNLEIWYPADDE